MLKHLWGSPEYFADISDLSEAATLLTLSHSKVLAEPEAGNGPYSRILLPAKATGLEVWLNKQNL